MQKATPSKFSNSTLNYYYCSAGIFFLLTIILIILPPNVHGQIVDEMTVDEMADLSLTDLANIRVVSASKKSQVLKETPATVRVISAETIRERGYLTLDEALADLPGFQFRNIQGFNSYVFMRGVPSQNNLILVLVDGIQINELNSGGFYGGAHYNLANVARIEVVYGPASALYGTNAISGIINIITKKPDKYRGLDLNASYGSFKTLNTAISYGYYNENKEYGFRISGMYKESEKADLGANAGDGNWSDNMENFEDDLALDGSILYKNFDAGLIIQDKQASRTTNYRTEGTQYQDTGSHWHIRFTNAFLRYDYTKSENWSLTSELYYRNATVLNNTIAYIDTNAQYGYYRPNSLFGFESIFDYSPIPRLDIILGLVLENEQLAEGFSKTSSSSPQVEPPEPSKPDMENDNLQSLFLETQYLLTEQTLFSTGLRFDNSSVYDQVLTPRLGLVYNKDKLTGKFLYLEAFRAPKPWDYNYGNGNPNLDPEKMRSFELFMSYNFYEDLRLESSLYKNTVYDLLGKDTNLDKWINHGNLETNGIELTLKYSANKIDSYVNYTFNDSQDDNNKQITEIAKHSANIGFSYRVQKNLKVALFGNYLGERKNPHLIPNTGDDTIDQAFILNCNISYNIRNGIDIQLTGKNILDKEYYHTSNRSVSRYRQPQRSILLRLSFHYE